MFKQKYLKYKKKYLNLKNKQRGGVFFSSISNQNLKILTSNKNINLNKFIIGDILKNGQDSIVFNASYENIKGVIKVPVHDTGNNNLKKEIQIYEYINYLNTINDKNIRIPEIYFSGNLQYNQNVYNYIFMEKIEKDLITYCKENKNTKQIFDKVYSGISYLHENNIIFKDLHVGQLMVSKDNIVFLDFGRSIIFNAPDPYIELNITHQQLEKLNSVIFDKNTELNLVNLINELKKQDFEKLISSMRDCKNFFKKAETIRKVENFNPKNKRNKKLATASL